jgi:hypothetical protein
MRITMINFKIYVFDPLNDSNRDFLVRAQNLLKAREEALQSLWELEEIVTIIPQLEVVKNE